MVVPCIGHAAQANGSGAMAEGGAVPLADWDESEK